MPIVVLVRDATYAVDTAIGLKNAVLAVAPARMRPDEPDETGS
jgi:hypothetical protein